MSPGPTKVMGSAAPAGAPAKYWWPTNCGDANADAVSSSKSDH